MKNSARSNGKRHLVPGDWVMVMRAPHWGQLQVAEVNTGADGSVRAAEIDYGRWRLRVPEKELVLASPPDEWERMQRARREL